MNSLQILNRGGAAKVEQVISYNDVASSTPLAGGDVGECVLDGDTATQSFAPAARVLKVTELPLKRFITGNRYGSPSSGCCLRAPGPQVTGAAFFRVEVHRVPRFEWLDLTGWTRDCLGPLCISTNGTNLEAKLDSIQSPSMPNEILREGSATATPMVTIAQPVSLHQHEGAIASKREPVVLNN